MIYAYIRVSTDKQTVENQRFEIENYCRKRQIDVDQYIEETISGMKDVDKRKLKSIRHHHHLLFPPRKRNHKIAKAREKQGLYLPIL